MVVQDQVKLYEGMFLLRQEAVANDFAGCVEFLRTSFERAEAEVTLLRRWEERRLAGDIKGQKRGVFLLAYFRAPGGRISSIERDCNLSEQVLRCLIIRADHVGDVELGLELKQADPNLAVRPPIDEATGSNKVASAEAATDAPAPAEAESPAVQLPVALAAEAAVEAPASVAIAPAEPEAEAQGADADAPEPVTPEDTAEEPA